MFRKLIVAVAIVAIGYTALVYFAPDPFASNMTVHETTNALIERDAPLPTESTVTNVEHGGLFAQYLFVKMKVEPEELDRYMSQFPGALAIGKPKGIQVVAIEDCDLEALRDPKIQIKIKHSVNDGYLPWWNIDSIENGTYIRQSLPDACGFEAYSDTDESILYIYWNYS